ncbi:MAG: hypothetical protein ACKPJJ_20170, partial [Planctomycetaceae bacterium]
MLQTQRNGEVVFFIIETYEYRHSYACRTRSRDELIHEQIVGNLVVIKKISTTDPAQWQQPLLAARS